MCCYRLILNWKTIQSSSFPFFHSFILLSFNVHIPHIQLLWNKFFEFCSPKNLEKLQKVQNDIFVVFQNVNLLHLSRRLFNFICYFTLYFVGVFFSGWGLFRVNRTHLTFCFMIILLLPIHIEYVFIYFAVVRFLSFNKTRKREEKDEKKNLFDVLHEHEWNGKIQQLKESKRAHFPTQK